LNRYVPRYLYIALSLAVIAAALVHLSIGDLKVTLGDLMAPESNLAQAVFWQLRLPRTLAAIVVGAALASSGCVLQTLLRNPLAEPGLLGISSGASLCVVALIVVGGSLGLKLPLWSMACAAFVGALSVALLLYALSRRYLLASGEMLLFGVVIGIIASAGLTWLIYLSTDQSLRQLMNWMMGSLSFATSDVYWLWPLLLGLLVVVTRYAHALNFVLLGDSYAFAMGIDIKRLRPRLVMLVSLLTAIAVSIAGTISFVGLLVPHILRQLLGDDQRTLIWMSALGGALTLLVADMLARTVLDGSELPIGVITATLGGPVLIYLLVKRHGV
jgi:vitamin B12 transport system permease protein